MFLDMTISGELKIIEPALQLAFTELKAGDGAVGYFERFVGDDNINTLTLVRYFSQLEQAIETPFVIPHTVEQLVPLVTSWLEAQDYGQCRYQGDGDKKRGVKVYTNQFKHHILATFEPHWIIVGK